VVGGLGRLGGGIGGWGLGLVLGEAGGDLFEGGV